VNLFNRFPPTVYQFNLAASGLGFCHWIFIDSNQPSTEVSNLFCSFNYLFILKKKMNIEVGKFNCARLLNLWKNMN
jgi:hypothetical protein